MASTLLGPAESRLLSRKVMPTEPLEPVETTSPACTAVPTVAGSFCPPRSICTGPEDTLMRPASCALVGPDSPAVRTIAPASMSRPRSMISPRKSGIRLPDGRAGRAYNTRMTVARYDRICPARRDALSRVGTFLAEACDAPWLPRDVAVRRTPLCQRLFTTNVPHDYVSHTL